MSGQIPRPTPSEIVAQTVVNYYHQFAAFTVPVSEALDWHGTLPPKQQALLLKLDVQQWTLLPAFRRYALEARGCSMQAYMAEHLTPAQLAHWVDDGDGGVRPA